ncbi:HNH endonuclease [Streptomyces sp. NPDC102340]|uniref:HNH endonuclease n=1 Tax=unclassified Streptomyces TaxID=2593676 RepID=UPI0037F4C7CE
MSALTPAGSTRRWRMLRADVLDRDGHRCHWCKGPANTVDHLIPRVRGGSDDVSNLAAACTACNSRRGQAEAQQPRNAPPSRDW